MTNDQMRARLAALEKAIFATVKHSRPEPACWLESDAGPSYCHEHAVKARAEEFGLGPPIYERNYIRMATYLEDRFYGGIEGGYHGQGVVDHTERCHECGKLLAYTLTDYGADEEVEHWLETTLTDFTPDDAYQFWRLCINFYPDGGEESQSRARDILKVAEEVAAFLGLEVPAEVAA